MRRLIFIFFFFITVKGFGQYDTGQIRKVFDYLQTNEFAASLKELSELQTKDDISNYKEIRKRAKAYRNEQKEHVLFWASPTRCFFPAHDYLVPDTSARHPGDSILSRKFERKILDMKYSRFNKPQCSESKAVEVYFLDLKLMELHYFRGIDMGMKFGYTEVLRFKTDEPGKTELLLIAGIHHN